MIHKTLIIIIISLISIFISAAQAQVEEIILRVDGLACPFCAFGLEKKLKKLEGYRSLNVLINEGKAIIEWQPAKPVNLDTLYEAVKEAGFTLRSVRGSFVGTFSKEDKRYFLVLPHPLEQRFYLYEPSKLKFKDDDAHRREGTLEALNEATWKQLKNLLAKKKVVKIIGSVHSHKGTDIPVALGIEKLEVQDTKKEKD